MRTERLLKWALATASLLSAWTCNAQFYPLDAQFLGRCGSTYSQSDLEASIANYHEHTDRLSEKFVTGYYRQGAKKGAIKFVDLQQVKGALRRLAPRRSAVLFYAYGRAGPNNDGLCIWLISPFIEPVKPTEPREVVFEQVPMNFQRLEALRADIVKSLGVLALARDVMPLATGEVIPASAAHGNANPALAQASATLLPGRVIAAIKTAQIDTVIVLPIFDVGAIPFAALPVGSGKMLIDLASVVVAPGFFVFLEAPATARTEFPNAVVVANPEGWTSERERAGPLPNAQAEAGVVAGKLKQPRVLTSDATLGAVSSAVTSKPGPALIYLAAHGRADEENPLDGGFLLLRDGPWKAKEIAKLNVGATRPLVVLSACQTGLGKNFEVGNIGVARAWQQAGASNVVMSLWSVYKPSTQDLMGNLITLVHRCPPDKALRAAMLKARTKYVDPAHWAGFSIYGLPQLPAAKGASDPLVCGE